MGLSYRNNNSIPNQGLPESKLQKNPFQLHVFADTDFVLIVTLIPMATIY